jgi:glycosyltransferase involved in cell wall biosynthesis
MKIAIDARIINSGTGRYIERLIHYLEELDTTNDYLILVRHADLGFYKPTNPRFHVVEAEFADYSFGEQLGFNRLLRKLKPDLVHFCMPQQPLLYTRPAVTSVLDLNLLRISSNDTMNAVELRVKKVIFGLLLWIVAHRTTRVLTISNYTKQDLLRFSRINPNKITVAYLGADQVAASSEPVAAYQNVPFILYVGRAEPYKNNRGLMAAHQQLLKTNPDLRLVIAGPKDAMREGDMRWAAEKQFHNIDFLGFVSDQQLAWLYQHCRAYVVPSLMEGFGMPGLEAMAYGAPVASSHASCLPEVYGDGAIYFDPTSPDDMARVIGELIASDSQRAELSAKGKQQTTKYSWRRFAEQTLALYKDTLGQNLPKTD